MEFVRIPRGSFLMGAPEGEKDAAFDETPQHRVEITSDFYLGKYAVTQAEYRGVTGQSRSHFKGDRLPVESLSWDEAVKFCELLSSRTQRKVELPSEAMWEYACRSGTTTPFHFGSKLNGDLANCDGDYPYGTDVKGAYKNATVAVGSYLPNPWGLYDMHGNVWEWCQDYYGPYDKVDGAADPVRLIKQSNECRVLRGGSWSSLARYCRAAYRRWSSPDSRNHNLGFRVCLRLDLL
jgi:formylglycine-generating enzyme required for sulfatase activity